MSDLTALSAAVGVTLISAIVVIMAFIAAFTMFSRSDDDFVQKFLSSLMFLIGLVALFVFPAILWNLWQAVLQGS